MNEVKVTGIVLKAIDYREKDKLITIYSVELGLITAVLKGVNSAKAKLKFASLPFCLAEFVLAQRNGFFTVVEVSQIESFYNITSNYNKSLIGFLMLETTCIIIRSNDPDERWFILLLNYLKELAYGNANSYVLCVKFILETLAKYGYQIDTKICDTCGMQFLNDVYLDYDTGELKCETCFSANSQKLTKQEYAILKIIDNSQLQKLSTIKVDDSVSKSLLLTLKNNLELRANKKIKSLLN